MELQVLMHTERGDKTSNGQKMKSQAGLGEYCRYLPLATGARRPPGNSLTTPRQWLQCSRNALSVVSHRVKK